MRVAYGPLRPFAMVLLPFLIGGCGNPEQGAETIPAVAEFVGSIPWLHVDLMAWNTEARPGRPEGGEAQGIRAVCALLAELFGG